MSDSRLLRLLFMIILVLLGIFLIYRVLQPFIGVFAWGITIGIVTFPLYEKVAKRMNRHLAAAIMVLGVCLVFALPAAFFGLIITQDTVKVVEKVHEAGGVAPFIASIPGSQELQPLLERFNIHQQLLPALQDKLKELSGHAAQAAKGTAEFAMKVFLMLFVLYFVYHDGRKMKDLLADVLPFSDKVTGEIFTTIDKVVSGVFLGVFLTCIVMGILGGIGFAIAGLPSPVLFGAGMAIASLIPVVGTALFWLPASLYLFFVSGQHGMALFLAGWGVIVMAGIADHLVKPYFISGRARISLPTTIFGGIGGLAVFGIFGIIAGPLLLALALNLLDLYHEENRRMNYEG